MLNGQLNYRGYLKSALAKQTEKNPAYSMGALARATGLSRSFLSEVLRGKKNLSPEAGARITQKLGLSPSEAEFFSLLIQLETARDPSFRESLLEKIRALQPASQIHDLSLDAFRVIADWYHMAILQLTFVEGFKLSSRTISRRLGITIAEAEVAMDRLLRLELLEKKSDGSFRCVKDRFLAHSRVPDGAIARFHKQVLTRLSDAIGEQPPNKRKSRTEIMPIHESVVDQVEAILDRAHEEIIAVTSKSKPQGKVYALTTHFFDLTHERK